MRHRSLHARSKGRDAAAARWSALHRDEDAPSQLARREAGARERTQDVDATTNQRGYHAVRSGTFRGDGEDGQDRGRGREAAVEISGS
jgi:hypothetical protein